MSSRTGSTILREPKSLRLSMPRHGARRRCPEKTWRSWARNWPERSGLNVYTFGGDGHQGILRRQPALGRLVVCRALCGAIAVFRCLLVEVPKK